MSPASLVVYLNEEAVSLAKEKYRSVNLREPEPAGGKRRVAAELEIKAGF